MSGTLFHSEKPRIRPALPDREIHRFGAARAMASVGFSVGVAIDANVNVAADEMNADEWALTGGGDRSRLIYRLTGRPRYFQFIVSIISHEMVCSWRSQILGATRWIKLPACVRWLLMRPSMAARSAESFTSGKLARTL